METDPKKVDKVDKEQPQMHKQSENERKAPAKVEEVNEKILPFNEQEAQKISSINQSAIIQNTVQDDWFDDTFDQNRRQSEEEDDQNDFTSTNNILKELKEEKQMSKRRRYIEKDDQINKKEEANLSQSKQQKPSQTKPIQQKPVQPKPEDSWLTETMQIDEKYLLISYFMYRQDIQNIIPKGEGKIYLIPNKKGQVKVSAKSKQVIEKYIECVSDFINKIEVTKVNIKVEYAKKMISSRKLRESLRKDDLCLAMDDQYGKSQLFLGGKQKQKLDQKQKLQRLYKRQHQLKSYQFYELRLTKYLNTRSYRIIFDLLFDLPELNQIWKQKYNTQWIERVVPQNAQRYSEINERHFINILLTSYSRLNSIHYKQYQKFICDTIKSQCYCITLLLQRKGKYIEKISHQNVFFATSDEKQFDYSYLYIVLMQGKYADSVEGIIKIVQTLQKSSGKIIGVRYFRNIAPQFFSFKRKETQYCMSYPKKQPYSWVIRPKKGFDLNWKEHLLSIK